MLETGLGRVHRILAGPPPAPSWYPAAGACYAPAHCLAGKASWLYRAHPGRPTPHQLVSRSSVRCRLAGKPHAAAFTCRLADPCCTLHQQLVILQLLACRRRHPSAPGSPVLQWPVCCVRLGPAGAVFSSCLMVLSMSNAGGSCCGAAAGWRCRLHQHILARKSGRVALFGMQQRLGGRRRDTSVSLLRTRTELRVTGTQPALPLCVRPSRRAS